MLRFSETADAIAATSSKLAKVRVLADYLATLDQERLAAAARWFGGTVLPVGDGRVLGIGGAALGGVISALARADEATMTAAWRRHADAGDTTGDVLSGAGHTGAGVDLLEAAAAFDEIASTRGSLARVERFRDLLARCTPNQARYVVKLISGDMRIGLREGLVEEAIGRAFARDPAEVTRANMLVGDLGECAVLAAQDRLATAAPRLFAPLRFMLASPAADSAEVVARMGAEVWV
jgi:DNA ligase-1